MTRALARIAAWLPRVRLHHWVASSVDGQHEGISITCTCGPLLLQVAVGRAEERR